MAEAESMDELEMLLAGDDGVNKALSKEESADNTNNDERVVVDSVICIVHRGSALELYVLPQFTLIFRYDRYAAGNKVLTDGAADAGSHTLPNVNEVGMYRMSDTATAPAAPILFTLLDTGDLLLYQAFTFRTDDARRCPLRFRRIEHDLLTRPILSGCTATPVDWSYGRRLVPFTSLSGRPTVAIGGAVPALAFGIRHECVLLPLVLNADEVFTAESWNDRDLEERDGVACITPFHNVNCANGMIFVDTAGTLHICELPQRQPQPTIGGLLATPPNTQPSFAQWIDAVSYESGMTLRTIPLSATPRFIAYHQPTHSFAVILQTSSFGISQDEPNPRALPVHISRFALLLFSARTFTIIGRYDDFEAHEHVIATATVSLQSTTYLVVGTCIQARRRGELPRPPHLA